MILRIARLPLPGEYHDGVSPVLRACEYSNVLGRVSNRRRFRLLSTVRVLEHKGAGVDVRIIEGVQRTRSGAPNSLLVGIGRDRGSFIGSDERQVFADVAGELGLLGSFCPAQFVSPSLPTFSFISPTAYSDGYVILRYLRRRLSIDPF